MTKLKKIKKWAVLNSYSITEESSYSIMLEKEYFNKDNKVWANQIIRLCRNGYYNSRIEHRPFTYDKYELEDLFIPLNNVKRDEKLLKEYLDNES